MKSFTYLFALAFCISLVACKKKDKTANVNFQDQDVEILKQFIENKRWKVVHKTGGFAGIDVVPASEYMSFNRGKHNYEIDGKAHYQNYDWKKVDGFGYRGYVISLKYDSGKESGSLLASQIKNDTLYISHYATWDGFNYKLVKAN